MSLKNVHRNLDDIAFLSGDWSDVAFYGAAWAIKWITIGYLIAIGESLWI